MNIDTLLKQLHFLQTHNVKGQANIESLFGDDKCGIYVLHFENGAFYVGQAINIANRYKQHRQNHKDIEKISFKLVSKNGLDDSEKEAIKAFELEAELRNISLVTDPKRDMPFDELVSHDEQESWLNSFDPIIKHRDRIPNETLRKKYSKACARLMKNSHFTDVVLPVMQKYVECCFPEPFLTEVDYWSVSCINRGGLYSRINIYWQEILRVDTDGVHLFLRKSEFEYPKSPQNWLSNLFRKWSINKKWRKIYPSFWYTERFRYTKNGMDHGAVFVNYEDALKILDDPIIRKAIKAFTLSSMRLGATVFSRYHSIDLADELLKKIG